MKKYRTIGMIIIVISNLWITSAQQIEEQLEIHTDFLIYTPRDYELELDKRWPLLINLHGADRNVTIENIHHAYLPHLIESGKDLPMVVVNPVCNRRRWNVDELNHMLDEILTRYNIDNDRIYLSGFSMGGYGTWDWVFQNPERFAAISPIAGCAYPSNLEKAWRVRNTPIWIIHGEKDTTVEIECSRDAVKALKRYDANLRTTFYPNLGHKLVEIWGKTLTDDNWYKWLLKQNRTNNLPKVLSLSKKVQKQYKGFYEAFDKRRGPINILSKKGQLYANMGENQIQAIYPESKTLFSVEGKKSMLIEFTMENGNIMGLNLLSENQVSFIKKIKK